MKLHLAALAAGRLVSGARLRGEGRQSLQLHLHGCKMMPAKGGNPSLSEADVKAPAACMVQHAS